MNDNHDTEYQPVSFIANFQIVDEETPQKGGTKPTFSAQIYYFYVLLFSFSEYVLLFLLRSYYFAHYKMNNNEPAPTPDDNPTTDMTYNKYWDSEVIKYFFFRVLSLAAIVYINQNSILKIRYVFAKLFTAYPGTVFVIYGIIIWVGMVSVLNAFLLTNVILLVYSQSYYKLLAHVLKGYPLKKLDYKFLGFFTFFIIVFFIYKLEKFGDVILLVVCGYFYYTREEIARVNLDYEEVEILSYFTKAAVLLLFMIKFLVNITFDSFTFSFTDLIVGLIVCSMDYFRVYCYKKVNDATTEIDSSYYRDTNILIFVGIAFIFDLFIINGDYGFWHYLFSLIGIAALGYYNKAFLQQIASYKIGKKERRNDLEIELKGDS